MKEIKTIKINCECENTLDIHELQEFQGELKKRDDNDVRKIVNSIKKFGFSFPFFVWKYKNINNVLDGHGRLLALQKLDELGYLIPKLPVVYVSCKNDEEARDLLLRLNSNYGKMSKESVLDFIGDYKFNFDDFQLPDVTFDIEKIDLELNKEDFKEQELDSGFYFSVVFNTRKERDEWLQSRNLKLVEDNFIKISDFNI